MNWNEDDQKGDGANRRDACRRGGLSMKYAWLLFCALLAPPAFGSAPAVPVRGTTHVQEVCEDGRSVDVTLTWAEKTEGSNGQPGNSAVLNFEVLLNGASLFAPGGSEKEWVTATLNKWAAAPSAILRKVKVYCWPDQSGLAVTVDVDSFYTALMPSDRIHVMFVSGGRTEVRVRRDTPTGPQLVDASDADPLDWRN